MKKKGVFEYEKVARNGNNEKLTQWDAVSISKYCSEC